MISALPRELPLSPKDFIVPVCSDLSPETARQRSMDLCAIIRLALLGGAPVHVDATLNAICDIAAEIVRFERVLVTYYDEPERPARLAVARGFDDQTQPIVHDAICEWINEFQRPMLVGRGAHPLADATLRALDEQSCLALPLLAKGRVRGTVRLFGRMADSFQQEDAQLLWILILVAEHQLMRSSAHDGLLEYAFTDFLTGLKTRGFVDQQLDVEIARSGRKGQPFAVLMIDIDHFKELNDRHGHRAGDDVLRRIASILMRDMREIDTVARYGGEEFLMVLPETNGPGAHFVAERLRQSVAEARFQVASNVMELVSISVGVAVFGQDADRKHELIECADAALYFAKESGRDQVRLHAHLPVAKKKHNARVSVRRKKEAG